MRAFTIWAKGNSTALLSFFLIFFGLNFLGALSTADTPLVVALCLVLALFFLLDSVRIISGFPARRTALLAKVAAAEAALAAEGAP